MILLIFLECWAGEPDDRPIMETVVSQLRRLKDIQKNTLNMGDDDLLIGVSDWNIYKKDINIIASGLVVLFTKIINEGKSRESRVSILKDYLSSKVIAIEEIYEWLSNDNHYKEESDY